MPTVPRQRFRIALLGAVAGALALTGMPLPAVDFGDWARHVQRHDAWSSLDFRDPTSGLFLAARAATEDLTGRATLTLTAAPAERCRPDVVLVMEATAPAPADQETMGEVVFQWGNAPEQKLPSHLVSARGDRFSYLEVVGRFRFPDLAVQTSLLVRLDDGRRFEFPTAGMGRAWKAAEATCRSFPSL